MIYYVELIVRNSLTFTKQDFFYRASYILYEIVPNVISDMKLDLFQQVVELCIHGMVDFERHDHNMPLQNPHFKTLKFALGPPNKNSYK